MEIRMPRLDGLRATERLLAGPEPAPRVLMLTTIDRDEYLYRALRAGASSFLLKGAPRAQLVHAVRTALSFGQVEQTSTYADSSQWLEAEW